MTAERVLRALLRAYPPGFRARFADDIVESLTRDRAAARRRGARAVAAFWVLTDAQAT